MEQQAVIDFFDQAAAGWDAQLVRNEAVIGQILDNAGIRPGVSVLDVACGTGVLIPDYLERGAAQVTAIDIAPEMARIAREKFPQENVTVLCGDAAQTHFPAPFDCIVIYNAFPHFPEPERLISHLAGLLTPGGTLTVAHGFSQCRSPTMKCIRLWASAVDSRIDETPEGSPLGGLRRFFALIQLFSFHTGLLRAA